MCGRFVATRPIEDIARLLEVDEIDVPPELAAPRWNVAPQASIVAVTASPEHPGHRRLAMFRWGLVPSWAKDPAIGARAFNARSETVADKPMFRAAVARRRCVIPVDAFYEWAPAQPGATSARKQPWCFQAADGGILALAGLWEAWRAHRDSEQVRSGGREQVRSGGDGNRVLRSCTILTTDANEAVGRVHDRMPVVIAPGDLEEWLAPEPLDRDELTLLTRPAPAGVLDSYRVSTRVNDARSEGPELQERLAVDDLGPG